MLVFPGLGLKAGMLSEQTWRLRTSVEQQTLLANAKRVKTFFAVFHRWETESPLDLFGKGASTETGAAQPTGFG
jgi:hypothetical protein